MKHKHANVLIAIAEGKDVQWMNPEVGKWFTAIFEPYNPINNHEFEWRIKPEAKPDIIKYIHFDADSEGDEVYINDYEENKHFNWDLHLKVIIDGETGKLKSAEVIS